MYATAQTRKSAKVTLFTSSKPAGLAKAGVQNKTEIYPLEYTRKNEMNKSNYLSVILLAAICTFAAGCASTSTQESTGEYISDTWITTKVKSMLAKDSVVKATEVNVETFKGNVQLTGFVTSRAAMNQAVLIAENIEGVKSVKNGMQIK